MKNKKKLLVPLLLLVLLVVVGGTVAWLTKTNTLTNSFSVGSFTEPTTDPEDSSVLLANETGSLDGNLFEKSWVSSAEHKLLPGETFAKDPYVGIGPNSEDAVVYVYVENTLSNKVYFTINNGWEAVTNETTAGSASGTYTSGLFKYTNGLTASTSADVWTSTPLFSQVVVDQSATATDFTPSSGNDRAITVKSFLHQAKDASDNTIDDTTVILPAAKAAFGIA